MSRLTAVLISAAAIAVVAPPAHADTSLAGYWPFDEGSGTKAADVSGYGNNGTLSGGVQWVPGHSGTALAFDGATGNVRVPDAPSLEPAAITVQAWVKVLGSPGNLKYIVAKGGFGCTTGAYGLYTGPQGGLMFYVDHSDGVTYTQSPDAGTGVWDGHWHFVAGTYDGSAVRLYVDGTEVGTGTPDNSPLAYGGPTSNDLYIGHYEGCPGLDFNGTIDEPKIWDRALSPQQVQAQYSPCAPGTKANFRWHYSANGSAGSWSGTKSAICPASLAMGPQAMEGDLKVSPGATLAAGYDFTVPGNNAMLSLAVVNPQVVFAVRCVSGATPSQPTLTVPLLGQTFSFSNSQWYPTGDQHSPLVYQGSVTVPNLCGGGQVRFDRGGTFTASID
jgi:hypothetical protein